MFGAWIYIQIQVINIMLACIGTVVVYYFYATGHIYKLRKGIMAKESRTVVTCMHTLYIIFYVAFVQFYYI